MQLLNIDWEQSCPAESIAQKRCDICGRVELVSQPGPDAFVKWRIIEGTLCPRCVRGRTWSASSSSG
jgi:hypothetical protein